MKTIAVYNFKGGSFKTTATHTLATGLAVMGYKVLVLDTDPQAHATLLLGINPQPNLYDLMVRNASWKDAAFVANPKLYSDEPVAGQVVVVPGNDESGFIPLKIPSPQLLRKRLEQVQNVFDVCLIDTSPTPSLMSSVVYLAADSVIYPSKCEALHYDGLIRAIEARDAANELRLSGQLPPIKTLGIIPAIYRSQTTEHVSYYHAMQQLNSFTFTPVPDRIMWAEASRQQKPVFTAFPNSAAAQDAWTLIQEFEGELQHA